MILDSAVINVNPRRAGNADRQTCTNALLVTARQGLLQAGTSHALLLDADRRKDEFMATLGHELRSPLASISNAVRLLASQQANPQVHAKAQAMIERQVGRMTQLIDDMLDVSRLTRGRLRLHLQRTDLRVVVHHAIQSLESELSHLAHRLSIQMPVTAIWLDADASRLEQVFANLLANAAKYTEPGGNLAIWMHTRTGEAIVRVRDSGMGIGSTDLPHIFDLFRQAHSGDPRSHSGLGVGLAVVRNLVELHGGSVTAASAGAGEGSEFTVRLPWSG